MASVEGVLQECYKSATRVLQGCCNLLPALSQMARAEGVVAASARVFAARIWGPTRVLQGGTRVLQSHYNRITIALQSHYKSVTRSSKQATASKQQKGDKAF
jgi:hypothetical protein